MLWLALSSFCFLTRASEMFVEPRSHNHERYCLRRTDIVFFRGRVQLGGAQWSTADRVEVRFGGSKGDQLRKGVVVSRVRTGSPRPVGAGGDAVDIMIELTSFYLLLPAWAPLVVNGSGSGRWSMWTKQQATVSLRELVALTGVRVDEYALHPSRNGSTPHSSPGGGLPRDVAARGPVGV